MVVFDTPLLIYGIQHKAPPEAQDLIARTQSLLRTLKQKKVKVMVPAPALAEFLVKLPPPLQTSTILTGLFSVGSFDAYCAQISAELQADSSLISEIRSEHNIHKQCLKVDTMIIATAIAYGANSIYTNDEIHFKKLAKQRILVQGLSSIQIQRDFFDSLE